MTHTARGSTVQAKGTTSLSADNAVFLLASANTAKQSSSQSSSSSSIGIDTNANITLGANSGSGDGKGVDISYNNTQVGGKTVSITSAGDTTLKGAVVAGNSVKTNIGGNLKIESLQDRSNYTEQSKSEGGSLSFNVMTGVPTGASINAGQTDINSNYASVKEQSAIKAGDGGFQVDVKGKTDLKGGAITSTQKAIDNNTNTYTSAGGTTLSDLNNQAEFKAKGTQVSVGVGSSAGGSAGVGQDSGNASSVTVAAISGVAGNKAARTGDAQQSIAKIFDAAKVSKEVNAQVAITSEFGKQACKAVGDYAGSKLTDLKKQANTETDPSKKAALLADAAKWEEGGAYRVALHTVVGGLTGGASGALGAGASSAAAPSIDQLQTSLEDKLKQSGMGQESAKALASLIGAGTATVIGAAASGGSVAGGATALNADMNNRQLHPTEAKLIKENAKRYAQQRYGTANPTTAQIQGAEVELANTAQNLVDNNLGVAVPKTSQAEAFLNQLKVEYAHATGSVNIPGTAGEVGGKQQLFYANTEQKNMPWLNQGSADPAVTGLIVKTPINPPNAAIKMQLGPNWSYMGANSAGVAPGVTTENRTQAEIDKSLNDTTKAIAILPVAIGAVVVATEAALISGGVNATAQILKGEKFSPTEVLISTTMGPLGAVATEAQAVKALIEQGGKAAIAANAGIGAATNVAGDTATKVITGQSVTAAGAVVAAGSGAFGGVVSTKPVVQGAVTEATGAVLKELTDPEEKK